MGVQKQKNKPEVRRGTLGKQFAKRGTWSTGLIMFHGDIKWTKYSGELLPECVEGSVLDVLGDIVVHKQYGKQFKITSVVAHLPGDYHGIQKWLAIHLPWIGPERSKLLLRRFGVNIWNVIERCPHRCTEISGITEDRVADITAAYDKVRQQRIIIVELLDLGLSMQQAQEAVSKWGSRALDHIQERPYALYYTLESIKFSVVDQIALKLGVSKTASMRIEAFALKCLRDNTLPGGHCMMVLHTLVAKVAVDTKVNRSIVAATISAFDLLVSKDRYVMERHLDEAEATVAYIVGFLHTRRKVKSW